MKIEFFEQIGEVVFVKYKRSKNMRILLKANQRIKVTLPYRTNYQSAIDFVHQKKNWILHHQSKLNNDTTKNQLFRTDSDYATREHRLIVRAKKRQSIQISVEKGQIAINYPETIEVENKQVQQAIRKGITEALRIEARKYLPPRTLQLAKKHGLSFGKIFVKNVKTRWGSCSSVNNINLNIHLMRLPDRLIDYVILHELAHTVEKNHSASFWAFLETLCTNARQLDHELKQHHITY